MEKKFSDAKVFHFSLNSLEGAESADLKWLKKEKLLIINKLHSEIIKTNYTCFGEMLLISCYLHICKFGAYLDIDKQLNVFKMHLKHLNNIFKCVCFKIPPGRIELFLTL